MPSTEYSSTLAYTYIRNFVRQSISETFNGSVVEESQNCQNHQRDIFVKEVGDIEQLK